MPDFWRSSGYRWLDVRADGRLVVTDDFLRATLLRSELAPVPQSCAAEIAIYDTLVASPRAAIAPGEMASIAEADVRDRYDLWLRFRQSILASPTLEAAYLSLFREDVGIALFLAQMLTEIFLRHILGRDADPLEARAGEMLFRPQKIAFAEDGMRTAADLVTVGLYAATADARGAASSSEAGRQPLRSFALDTLDATNASIYWDRDERHDLAVSLHPEAPTQGRLCRVLEKWIAHFLGLAVVIRPRTVVDDKGWVWHIGLDAEASGILNDMYNRAKIEDERRARLLSWYELSFENPRDMRPAIAGRPVYMAMAADADGRLMLRPQNLLLNLPVAPSK